MYHDKDDQEEIHMIQKEVLEIFPQRLQRLLQPSVPDWQTLEEIRIRCGKVPVLKIRGKKYETGKSGDAVTQREIREIVDSISRYSLYAFEEEVKKGYLTIPGGHRVGMTGKVLMERGEVRAFRNLVFLNVRISHEMIGCSDSLMPYFFQGNQFLSTLIVSPPGAGKTTLLRDIVRNLANGGKEYEPFTVAVIDERSEIAGCYQGVPQKDVGRHCDVLDGCEKAEGIHRMIRSMSPEVVAVDEIGTKRDCEALGEALTSGCGLIATVHGRSIRHLLEKPSLNRILEAGMFERIVFLSGGEVGRVQAIYDGKGKEKIL